MTAPEVLIDGQGAGEVLRLSAPISFWGGVDPVTSKITLATHPERDVAIRDRVLVIPKLIGSSSTSAIMLELCYERIAPAAVILMHRDAILPVGVVVARQMGWPAPPVLLMPGAPYQTGDHLRVGPGGRIESAGAKAPS